jgi:hypothetical protein
LSCCSAGQTDCLAHHAVRRRRDGSERRPRHVQITATLHPPRAGVTIYFSIEDPPDSAPYVSGVPNDNLGGLGTLSAPTAVTDAAGHASTILTITDRYSGDNYVVRASFTLAGPVIARSGIITAWKRLFL